MRRLTHFGLASLLALATAACGSDDSTSGTSSGTSSGTETGTGTGTGQGGDGGSDGGSGGMGGGTGGGTGGATPADASLSFTEATSTAAEADGMLDVTVTLTANAPTTSAITVPLNVGAGSTALDPDDYASSVGDITFPAGSQDGEVATVTLTLVNDALVEGDEVLSLELGTPVGADLGAVVSHEVTIVDSDEAFVDLQAAGETIESGSGGLEVVLSATGPSGPATLAVPLTVEVADAGTGTAAAGADYVAAGSVGLTFEPGAGDQSVATAAVDVVPDLSREQDETIDFALQNPAAPLNLGAGISGTLTILDDDRLVTANGQNVYAFDQVDPTTSLTGSSGYGYSGTVDPEGAAFDAVNNLLYISGDSPNDALFVYDPITGSITLVGQLAVPGLSFTTVESLAYDPNGMVLYGVDDGNDTLLEIDPQTGNGSVVGSLGALGTSTIEGLAFDPTTNTLYGADDGSNELVVIDTMLGTATVVGPFGPDGATVESLTFDPTTNTLYGIDEINAGTVITIDTTTGAATAGATLNGNLPASWNVQALAFDSIGNTMWAVENVFERAVTIDPATGLTTFDGLVAYKDIDATTWDVANGRILGIMRSNDYLVAIDPTTGEPSPLAELDQSMSPDVNAMAYDNANTTLYVESDGDLYTMDVVTGAATLVGDIYRSGTTTSVEVEAMTFDDSGVLWAVSSDELFTIDPATGIATLVGPTGVTQFNGLAWDATTSTLYATRNITDLYTLNTTTGAGTLIGEVGADEWDDLTIDPTTGTLYAWDNDRETLISIDPVGKTLTTIGAIGVNGDALAYDPVTMTYYASDFLQDFLFTIDWVNTTATSVGPLGVGVHGMAFDSANAALYGVTENDDLVTVDLATGATTTVGATAANLEALAFDGAQLWASDSDTLFSIDPASGVATVVGAHGAFTDVRGLGYDPAHGLLYGSDVAQKAIVAIDPLTGAATSLRRSRNEAPYGMTFER